MWLSHTTCPEAGSYVIVASLSAPSSDTRPPTLETRALPVTRSEDSWLPSRSHIGSGRSGTPKNSSRSSWRYARYKFVRGGFTIEESYSDWLGRSSCAKCSNCGKPVSLVEDATPYPQTLSSKLLSVVRPSGRSEGAGSESSLRLFV